MPVTITYDVVHHIYWENRVALDLFFGGTGVGLFLSAFWLTWHNRREHRSLIRAGIIIAPFLVMLGLIFLLSELGQPFRIYELLIHPQATSVLAWGSWLQGLFLVFSLIYAWQWWRAKEGNESTETDMLSGSRRWIGWIAALLSLAIGVYHGFLLSVNYGRALWQTPETTITSVLLFLITGLAALSLLGTFTGLQEGRWMRIRNLLTPLSVILWITLGNWLLWIAVYGHGTRDTREAASLLMIDSGWLFWGVALTLGLVIPALGLGWLRRRKNVSMLWVRILLLAVLAGGYASRFLILYVGQLQPLT